MFIFMLRFSPHFHHFLSNIESKTERRSQPSSRAKWPAEDLIETFFNFLLMFRYENYFFMFLVLLLSLSLFSVFAHPEHPRRMMIQ